LTLGPNLGPKPFSYFDPHCITHQENKVGSFLFLLLVGVSSVFWLHADRDVTLSCRETSLMSPVSGWVPLLLVAVVWILMLSAGLSLQTPLPSPRGIRFHCICDCTIRRCVLSDPPRRQAHISRDAVCNISINYKWGNAMYPLCDQLFSYLCITRNSRQNGVSQGHLSPHPGVTAAVGGEPK
jgi:hypothetical protein